MASAELTGRVPEEFEQEDHQELNSTDTGAGATSIGRRSIVRRGLKIGSAAAAAGILAHEVETYETGVETPYATYFPLYEDHIDGIKPSDIPDRLDGFFRENSQSLGAFSVTADNLIHSTMGYKGPDGKYTPLFATETLAKLYKNNTPLLFGDIWYKPEEADGADSFQIDEFYAGAALAAIQYLIMRMLKERAPTNRRKFLKGATNVMAAWLAAPTISDATLGFAYLARNQALSRISARIEGETYASHPENIIVLFRNLVMADKLLVAAESGQQQSKYKQRIAYNVGGGHGEIEDLLRLGPAAIRALLLAFPHDWLARTVAWNGGVDDFCSVRKITIGYDETVHETDDDQGSYFAISDSRIIDHNLRRLLLERGFGKTAE